MMRAPFHHAVASGLSMLLAVVSASASAEPGAPTAPWMTLTATASADADVDRMTVRLRATRDGRDAATVQAGLQQAVADVLRRTAADRRPGQVDVHSGDFSLSPRRGPQGAITGWTGTADVVIEGSDLAAVASIAGRPTELVVADVGFGLSPARRAEAETRASAEAIAQFRTQALSSAKAFGFTGFTLHDVELNANLGSQTPMAMTRFRAAKVDDEPLPVQPGHSTVTVTVRGAVELLP